MPYQKRRLGQLTSGPASPPRYVLKSRRNIPALYRNGRLHGLDVTIVATKAGRVTLQYHRAEAPGEPRVSHELPAALLSRSRP